MTTVGLCVLSFVAGVAVCAWATVPHTRHWKDEAERLKRELFIWQSRD